MKWEPIRTVEDATRVLAGAGLEVISIQRGWMLRAMDKNHAYREILCHSADELCVCARGQQRRRLGLVARDSFIDSSLSSAGNRCQATLSGWMRPPMEIKHKEVAR
jgi:hypothetical protein